MPKVVTEFGELCRQACEEHSDNEAAAAWLMERVMSGEDYDDIRARWFRSGALDDIFRARTAIRKEVRNSAGSATVEPSPRDADAEIAANAASAKRRFMDERMRDGRPLRYWRLNEVAEEERRSTGYARGHLVVKFYRRAIAQSGAGHRYVEDVLSEPALRGLWMKADEEASRWLVKMGKKKGK